MTGTNRPPLAGVRIVAIEQYGAGPFGTMYLADLGAEIVKIEDPGSGGDVSRYIPPGQQDKNDPLGQRGYIGATTYMTAVVLNNGWGAVAWVGTPNLA